MLESWTVEGREDYVAFGADDAEVIAVDTRVPADIHHPADAAFVFDHQSSRVFDRQLVHHVGDLAADAGGLAEQEVEDVDAVRSDVVERTSTISVVETTEEGEHKIGSADATQARR
jgi:hypothetical protein